MSYGRHETADDRWRFKARVNRIVGSALRLRFLSPIVKAVFTSYFSFTSGHVLSVISTIDHRSTTLMLRPPLPSPTSGSYYISSMSNGKPSFLSLILKFSPTITVLVSFESWQFFPFVLINIESTGMRGPRTFLSALIKPTILLVRPKKSYSRNF